jgi:hypothetical protein
MPERFRVVERLDLMRAVAIVACGGDRKTFFLYSSAVNAVLIGPENFLPGKIMTGFDFFVSVT